MNVCCTFLFDRSLLSITIATFPVSCYISTNLNFNSMISNEVSDENNGSAYFFYPDIIFIRSSMHNGNSLR
jgi:hypothetical protein